MAASHKKVILQPLLEKHILGTKEDREEDTTQPLFWKGCSDSSKSAFKCRGNNQDGE